MEQLTLFINNFISLSAEASPWLLLGLLIAGLMRSWLPSNVLSQHLGKGKTAIVKAALIGAPLPLCSCGVIPVATELRRSGASASATASFLVATPETGVDSVTVSYAMLGPIFAIYRPVAAIMSAIITGLLVGTVKESEIKSVGNTHSNASSCCAKTKARAETAATSETIGIAKTSCCSSTTTAQAEASPVVVPIEKVPAEMLTPLTTQAITAVSASTSSCCGSNTAKTELPILVNNVNGKLSVFFEKTKTGLHYAITTLIDDIIIWLAIGLIFAAIIRTFLPTDFLLSYGSGLPAMLVMIAISIPMYICATASTPVAAGFIMAGLSPGTALVFMMAGPATNISTLGVIKNEMGNAVLIRYLVGVGLSAIGFALLLDFTLNYYHINISNQMQHAHEILPYWFGLSCAAVIALLAIKPLRKLVL